MTQNGPVPFVDLIAPHLELEDELVNVFKAALRAGGFVGGPMVEDFERMFAQFCDTKFSVGVSSGTDALRFALMGAGVRAGDTVVTVPNTFIATTEAISQAGARFDFVDVDERTFNMDPKKLEEYFESQCYLEASTGKLTSRRTGTPLSAIVPVHLYGQTADMDPIIELAEQYGLVVLEDACQAHGAEYLSKKENCWKRAGSMGHAAAFSFYPGKNLGACGEGGAITTNDEALAKRMKMIRDHGQAKKYCHDIEGYNGRLDSMQAGFLSVKLRHLAKWNESRRALARRYHKLLADIHDSVIIPLETTWTKAAYHLYVVRVENREGLQAHLAKAGIGTGVHYPIPLHLQKAYHHLGYRKGDFPITERIAAEIVSLPMFPHLSHIQQDQVVGEIAEFLNARVASTT